MLRKWYREDWRYWRHFGLRYSVNNISQLLIEQTDHSYKMSLSISLQYQNRDDLRDMSLSFSDISLKLHSPHLKQAESYDLKYEGKEKSCRIIHHRLDKVDYTLSAYSSYKPILGDKARCDRIHLGTVTLNNITRVLTAKSFTVSVNWTKIALQESGRSGSQI